jgi:drug/metabolite transporter (DMT)-like permease
MAAHPGLAPESCVNSIRRADLALSPNIRGSLYMAVSTAAFSMNDAITKAVTSEINFGEVMLLRGLFAIVLIASLAAHQRALRPLRILLVKPVALRVTGEVVGGVSFLAALSHLPLANTYAIFQSLPLAITFGAAFSLGEPVGWRRWSAIAAGFVGVLIIVRPGVAGFNQFSVLALIAVLFCTLRDLATKRIPKEIPSLFVTLLTTVVITIAGGIIVVPLGGWAPVSGGMLGLLMFQAVLLVIGYHSVITALRTGDISAVAPFRYAALIWAMLLGFLLFGDVPDRLMLTGASIIVLSGLYAFYRERVRDKSRPAATTAGQPPDGL